MVKNNNFIKTLLISLMTILFYFLWPTLVAIILEAFHLGQDTLGAHLVEILFFLLLMVLFFLFYRSSFDRDCSDFRKNWKKRMGAIVKYTLLTFLTVGVINAFKIYVFQIDSIASNEHQLYQYFEKMPWMLFFMTTFYYPVVEEVVFHKAIREVIHHKWVFMIVSSLFFWYFNIAFGDIGWMSLVSSFYYFAGSFLLAHAYIKNDNLLVPIGVKILYNVIIFVIS